MLNCAAKRFVMRAFVVNGSDVVVTFRDQASQQAGLVELRAPNTPICCLLIRSAMAKFYSATMSEAKLKETKSYALAVISLSCRRMMST